MERMLNIMNLRCFALLLPMLLAGAAPASAAGIMGGRPVDPDHDFTIQLSVGQITDIQGDVNETTRLLFELEGRDPTDGAESYSLEELGLTESDITYGIDLEGIWRYVTLRASVSYMRAEATSIAPRDFFIGVNSIEFQGETYEYMKIEDGKPFDATIDAAVIAARMQITPFTIAPEHVVSFTPWLHLGVFALAGQFEVDQGEPERIQLYENPPREYVVGGHGEGDAGVFAPELGVGGEFRIYLGEGAGGSPRELVLGGTYAIFEYEGSSDSLGISSRNEKDLDVDYDMYEARAQLFWPISKTVDLVLGGEYRVITADASSKAQQKSLEEAQQNREKFDKDIHIELTFVNAFAGFRF